MFGNTEASEQNRTSNKTQGGETVRIITGTGHKTQKNPQAGR